MVFRLGLGFSLVNFLQEDSPSHFYYKPLSTRNALYFPVLIILPLYHTYDISCSTVVPLLYLLY